MHYRFKKPIVATTKPKINSIHPTHNDDDAEFRVPLDSQAVNIGVDTLSNHQGNYGNVVDVEQESSEEGNFYTSYLYFEDIPLQFVQGNPFLLEKQSLVMLV